MSEESWWLDPEELTGMSRSKRDDPDDISDRFSARYRRAAETADG